ncbi:TraB/GumN family protein [Asticcacaulis sp.]|uniref:TraB/GumN family protein n=1 Tax=Asticcacaulis sp. TaxID=1872648 RepID=UPI002B741950|nr:TraB/GumN family protein [Asticcacaulis sp.]HTM80215.1 TraB/GumN family protein [Asticcacaulis sp.]
MRVIPYADGAFAKKRKRSSRWLVEAGIIMGAAVGIAIVVPPLGMWWHRSHNSDATVVAFSAAADPDAAEALAGPTGSPLLWVMKTGDSTVYLFGGFNSADNIASGWMDQRLFKAFDNADTVVFEVGAYPDALPADKVTLRPDAALFQRATALRKMTLGLDGGAEAGRVTAEGVTDDGFVLPADAWRNGDQKVLTDTLALLAEADPAGYDSLIVQRNRAWLRAIEKALSEKGTTFVTVGATHLIGPDGLVAQLRGHAYPVTRLDFVAKPVIAG